MAGAAAFLCFVVLCLCSRAEASSPPVSSNATTTAGDELALLSFRSMLSAGGPSSWNTSIHYCSWPGVSCSRRHPGRVVALRMGSSFNLSGRISPFLANLSFLRELDLGGNQLSGEIPPELGRLGRLEILNLSMNALQGEIPATIGANMGNLFMLDLRENFISGEIPPSLTELPSMEFLFLYSNRLSGEIPAALSNLSSLMHLDLDTNMFSGAIPSSLGMLSSLSWLNLANNNLSGTIPASIWNISSLWGINIQQNNLDGVIPSNAFSSLPELVSVAMDDNRFHGHLPASLANATNVRLLQLGSNLFSGVVPPELGMLRNLKWLLLSFTLLEAKQPRDWEFIAALSNCSQLKFLELEGSKFGGVLPDSISNLSTSTELISLQYNTISGRIPKDIGNLINLQSLILDANSLTGTLPSSLGRLQSLKLFSALKNKISGPIPLAIGNLTELYSLELQVNAFSGAIPSMVANLTKLSTLNLGSNNFTGPIPRGLFSILALSKMLDLSNNNLEGSIPQEIGNLKSLVEFHAELKLVLIPVAIISPVAILVFLLLLCKFLTWRKTGRARIPSTNSIQGHPRISFSQLARATDGFSANNLLGSGTFGSVYKGNLGGQTDESAEVVAVKVLKLQTPGALKSFTAECEALRNLRHRNLVRIVTSCSSIDTRGYDFKAIVFDFMPNGSLEGWLHPDPGDQAETKCLSLLQRVTILLDVAHALDYLHWHGPSPVVHCDIKSSNVLLDADMVAHVGDFGLAKIIAEGNSSLQQSTSSMGFRGTIGYAAPEYGTGNMASTYGDIYSYGILVLETVTGKRPTDSRFRQGFNLREYVEQSLNDNKMDIVDGQLTLELENGCETLDDPSFKRKLGCLVSVLRLGISCSHELPLSRMQATDIAGELLAIRESLLKEYRTEDGSYVSVALE
ncbi:hypothetical protein ABZP36_009612 [Zizania latifolia]